MLSMISISRFAASKVSGEAVLEGLSVEALLAGVGAARRS